MTHKKQSSLILLLLVVSLIILIVWVKQQSSEKETVASFDFYDKELGIAFNYNDDYSEDEIKQIRKLEGNKLTHHYILESFKLEDASPEDYILSLIDKHGGNSENCEVSHSETYFDPNYETFRIDLKNKEIEFSDPELKEIQLADDQSEKDGSPFNGEWKKREIYNQRLVDSCTKYSSQLGLGTSTTIPSKFVFNNSKRLVWFEAMTDRPVFDEETIVLLD